MSYDPPSGSPYPGPRDPGPAPQPPPRPQPQPDTPGDRPGAAPPWTQPPIGDTGPAEPAPDETHGGPVDADDPAWPDAAPAWVGVVVWTAAALVGLVALQIIGILAYGTSFRAEPPPSAVFRVGYAFLTTLDRGPLGLVLLVAVLLLLVPVIARQRLTQRQQMVTAVTLLAAGLAAIVVILGGIFAVQAQFDLRSRQNRPVDGALRWSLATFVIRNIGLAAVALVAALATIRDRGRPAAPRAHAAP